MCVYIICFVLFCFVGNSGYYFIRVLFLFRLEMVTISIESLFICIILYFSLENQIKKLILIQSNWIVYLLFFFLVCVFVHAYELFQMKITSRRTKDLTQKEWNRRIFQFFFVIKFAIIWVHRIKENWNSMPTQLNHFVVCVVWWYLKNIINLIAIVKFFNNLYITLNAYKNALTNTHRPVNGY